MALRHNSTTVISDTRQLLNIANLDTASGQAVTRQLLTDNTLDSGTTVRVARDAQTSRVGATFALVMQFCFIQKGTVNFYFETYISSASGPGSVVITRYRNGSSSVILSQTVSATSYTAYNTDQSVLPGDRFDVTISGGSYIDGAKGTILNTECYIKNIRMRTNATTTYIPTNLGNLPTYVTFG